METIEIILLGLFAACIAVGWLLSAVNIEACLLFITAGVGAFVSLIIVSINISNTPSAMDVYQGKTTLEYKVVDEVKVDSCVVFKKK